MISSRPQNDSREMISLAEEELARLQRQLRIMEEDRMAFSEETGTKLRKQRKIIVVLKSDKEKLCEDINIATCENQKRRDKRFTKHVYKLLDEYEKYGSSVREESEQIKEIDVQIKKLEHDIRSKRSKNIVTDNDYRNCVTSGKKTVETLKNRLENVVKKFCGILTQNKTLREEIDHLLKERSHYNSIWDKLLKDIHEGKKFMVELIEQATLAFDQREEWCSKLEALRKRAQNDLIAHTEEMRDLQRNLDQYFGLREFLNVKGQKRVLKDLEEKEQKKRESHAQNLENQLEIFRKTLEQIRDYCGKEEDIDKIASQFVKQEEENFALFNYVNELNHEIETLNGNVDGFCEKIEEQVILCKERSKEHQATLASLQEDLMTVQKQANQDEQLAKNIENILDLTLKGIETIFDLLKCDRGPILYLLGESTTITLFNVMIYLGSIEKNVTDLITELFFAEKSMTFDSKTNKKENSDECN